MVASSSGWTDDDCDEKWRCIGCPADVRAGRKGGLRAQVLRPTGRRMNRPGAAGRRTRIWHKLAVIGLAFTVPLVAATYLLLNANGKRIDFSENELRGLEYLRPLGQLLPDLAAHRSYA